MNSDHMLEILVEAIAELEQQPDVKTGLVRLADILRELIGCSEIGVWLVNEQIELQVVPATVARLSSAQLSRVQEIAHSVAETQKPMILSDTRPDSPAAEAWFYTTMGVPLAWGGELLGSLVAINDAPGQTFTARDVRLAELFSRQAAAVIANERLVADVKRLLQSLTAEKDQLLRIQAAVRQVLEQSDKRANLIKVVGALQELGWGRVALAFCSDDLVVQDLITTGMLPAEVSALRGEIIPRDIWRRFLQGTLETYRLSGLYYVPGTPSPRARCEWLPGDVLFAPLRLGQGRVVGLIRLEDPVGAVCPTADSLRPLDILVSQAAYIVDNARLLGEASRSAEALAEQVDELSMIHRADRELGEHLNVDRVMRLTMDWALRRTHADAGLLALMTEDKRGLVPFITMGHLDREILDHSEQNPWPLDRGVVGRAARVGTTQLVRDVAADTDYIDVAPGTRSQISVPLAMRGEVLGVISLASHDKRAFDELDADFLERLARRAAVALDNARLYRQSEQLADDMAVLYSASRTITSTLNRDEVLQRIIQSMAVALECSSAVILSYHPETRDGEVLSVYRVGTVRNAQEILPDVQAAVDFSKYPEVLKAVEQRRSLILRAADPDLPLPEREQMDASHVQVLIVVPLVAQEELIGVVVIIEGRGDRRFNSNELFKLEALASQASVALRQSLLYGEIIELEKIKSEMIRMASHDLRNPLNNILGYVELISLSVSDMAPEVEEYVKSLQRSAKTMQSLIDDLLTLERVESELKSEWQAFDFGGLVYEVVESEQAGAALKRQALTLERESGLPLVFGSATQLRQAVTNLVGNAIKYTPEEGQIEVRLELDHGRLNFSVKDNGYGISPERQKRVFERFYRAREPGTDHIPGTGLGLSLVKTVVERHGGGVWFESTPGAGSTFGLWLPGVEER
jgi:signal transduction histidine kinase